MDNQDLVNHLVLNIENKTDVKSIT